MNAPKLLPENLREMPLTKVNLLTGCINHFAISLAGLIRDYEIMTANEAIPMRDTMIEALEEKRSTMNALVEDLSNAYEKVADYLSAVDGANDFDVAYSRVVFNAVHDIDEPED